MTRLRRPLIMAAAMLLLSSTSALAAPTIVHTNLPDGSTGISIAANIVVDFSEAMNPASVEASFSTYPPTTGTFTWLKGDTRLWYDPAGNLDANTTYAVYVEQGAANARGRPMAATERWIFTTYGYCGRDCSPPEPCSVALQSPADGTLIADNPTFSWKDNCQMSKLVYSPSPTFAWGVEAGPSLPQTTFQMPAAQWTDYRINLWINDLYWKVEATSVIGAPAASSVRHIAVEPLDPCSVPIAFDPVTLSQAHVDFQVDYAATVNRLSCGTVNFSVVSGPSAFSIDGAGARFYWTPDAPNPAETITIQVTETVGGVVVGSDTETFTVLVDDITMTAPLLRDYIDAPSTYAITGRAYGAGFTSYTLRYAMKETPDTWIDIVTSASPVDGVATDLLHAWDVSGFADGDWVYLRLEVDMGAYTSIVDNQVIFDESAMPGWPRRIAALTHSPAVADLTDDGVAEVIAVTHSGVVFVWSIAGNTALAKTTNYGATYSGAAIGDITGDGRPEIVWGRASGTGRLYAHRLDPAPGGGFGLTTVVNQGLPEGFQIRATPTLADLDGDGDLEIIVAAKSNDPAQAAEVVVYDYDAGTGGVVIAPGWPQPLTPPIVAGAPVVEWMLGASASVGNIDADAELEIVVAGRYAAYAFDANGAIEWGPVVLHSEIFPASTNGVGATMATSQPAIADLNGDGVVEIVIGSNVLTNTGAPLASWPNPDGVDSLSAAIGDVDGDGAPEIVLGNKAWNVDGSVAVGGVFATKEYLASAVLGDCGAGHVDIVSGTRTSGVTGIDAHEGDDGAQTPGYMKVLFGSTLDVAAAQIGDFDGDGLVDIAANITDATYGGIVGVWEMNTPNHDEHHVWPMMGHDLRRTGFYTVPKPNRPLGLGALGAGGSIQLFWTDASAVESDFAIERSPTGQGFTWVQIATVPANTTMFTDAPAAGPSHYRVRARRIDGGTGQLVVSEPSLPAAFTIP